MDKKILIGVIGEKLEIIQEQFDIIKAYEGKIPVIEIDLLMSNIRDFYELFISLQQENQGIQTASPAVKQEPVKKVEAPPAVVAAPEPQPEEIPEPEETVTSASSFRSDSILGFEPVTEEEETEEEEPEEVPSPAPAPLSESTPVPTTPSAPPPPETHHPNVHETRPQKATIDLFSTNSPGTLADRFREPHEKSVADRLQEHHISDLRTTIGINDKFLFINELFDGNMRVYDEAVGKLNECSTLAQADLMLLDLKIVYNWDSESPTVKKFVELVRRKFS